MGGKQEFDHLTQPHSMTTTAAKSVATQEQMRLARITQDQLKEDDQARIQKLVKKVGYQLYLLNQS